MKRFKLLSVFIICFLLTHSLPVNAGQDRLEVQTITTGPASLYANIVLIKGKDKLVLVDVPFTRSDTHRVIADILETGKQLETVIITHDHPDHFFGLDLILDTFPRARAVAHPEVVKDIWRSIPIKFRRWNPMLGNQAPHHPAVPESLDGDIVTLEGHQIRIIGPMQGDHVHATAVWVPDIKALIAGDLLFNKVFLWLGEHLPPQRNAWQESIRNLENLDPVIVVAGHKKPGLPDDRSAIKLHRLKTQPTLLPGYGRPSPTPSMSSMTLYSPTPPRWPPAKFLRGTSKERV